MDLFEMTTNKKMCLFKPISSCNDMTSLNNIVCGAHMSLVFRLMYMHRSFTTHNTKASLVHTVVEVGAKKNNIIPFPYEWNGEKFCLNGAIFERVISEFISSNEIPDNKHEILQEIFFWICNRRLPQATAKYNFDYSSLLQSINYMDRQNEALNRQYGDAKMQVMKRDGLLEEIPITKLPPFYKHLLRHVEFSVIDRGNGADIINLPSNLLLDLRMSAFTLIAESYELANVGLYDGEDSIASPLVLLGSISQASENYTPFTRSGHSLDNFKDIVCYSNTE